MIHAILFLKSKVSDIRNVDMGKKMARLGLIKKVIYKQRIEGAEGISQSGN